MITITQLEYVVAVDTYRHFVTASEKCFVSQPTLSMQIKKLEDELDVVIFDRSKQPIEPTQIGTLIIEQARKALAENYRIHNLVNEYKNKITGELTVGIIPSLAPYLLPLFVGTFARYYPDVKLNILELVTSDIIEYIQKSKLDLGILVTPLHEDGITELPIFYESISLYVSKQHELSQIDNIEPNQIAGDGLWLLSSGHCFRTQMVNLCSFHDKIKKDNTINYESGSLETIKKLVEKEGGYTLLPELSLDENTLNNSLAKVKKIGTTPPLREVSIVHSQNMAKNQLLNLFFNHIKQSVPQHLLQQNGGQIVEWRNK